MRYHWTPGTIALWDNRCTQHFVLNDFEGERVIQRVTVMGDHVEAAAEPVAQPWVREGRKSATSRHDRQMRQFLRSRDNAAEEYCFNCNRLFGDIYLATVMVFFR